MSKLVPLPKHPETLPWPTQSWPQGELPDCVNKTQLLETINAAFDTQPTEDLEESLACLIIHKGKLVFERYAEGHDHTSTFISWSMAKSFQQALVGLLVKEGLMDVTQKSGIKEWQGEGDKRADITLDQLLRMLDGLDFNEDYVDDQISHVIEMLFTEPHCQDMGSYAINRPLKHKSGEFWNYSSGTSNVVSRMVRDVVKAEGRDYRQFMQEELLNPIGMHSAEPKFDPAGTFVGSSFVYATARDFAKFGYLYLRDGMWDGKRILPEGWVDYTRTVTPQSEQGTYGAHFWLVPGSLGIFSCQGYEGQRIMMVPKLDLVVVRLGKTTVDKKPNLERFMKNIVDAFRGCV